MPKNVKIAILRVINDNSDPISEQACREMLMIGPKSVFRYWFDNTDGYLDFEGSTMFPWVNVRFTAADIDFTNQQVSRGVQMIKAYQATKLLNDNQELEGFDGFMVITAPGAAFNMPNPMTGVSVSVGFDGGAGQLTNGTPFCVLPISTSDHTFMCHELGHVLGLGHTYGVWNNGVDWDGAANGWKQGREYGDPYDIMSSGSFGRLKDASGARDLYWAEPQFEAVSPEGWPLKKIKMGPRSSLANVDFWDSSALRPGTIHHLQLPNIGKPVRLYAAGRQERSPRLIAIHPTQELEQGRGRCYIEYREVAGWDKGLEETGAGLDRRAVVVHTLADTPAAGVRCWYRGRILVPVEIDSDLAVAGTPYVVRAMGSDVADGYVDLEISIGSARGVYNIDFGDDKIVYGKNIDESLTPCGDPIVHADWVTESRYRFIGISYGYGGEGAPDADPPRIRWTVGGVPVKTGSGPLQVPTADGTFTVDFAVDPVTAELSLHSRPGDRFRVEVVATATEADGSNPTTASAFFSPPGYYTGFRRGDMGVLDRCMRKYLISVKLKPYEMLIPPGPDPYHAQWRDEINLSRVQEALKVITPHYPEQAAAIKEIATLRYRHIM